MKLTISQHMNVVEIWTNRCKTCHAIVAQIPDTMSTKKQWVHILFAKEKIDCDDPIPNAIPRSL